ncbi:hypothetical protein D3C85_1879490 [compost metagenome]
MDNPLGKQVRLASPGAHILLWARGLHTRDFPALLDHRKEVIGSPGAIEDQHQPVSLSFRKHLMGGTAIQPWQ